MFWAGEKTYNGPFKVVSKFLRSPADVLLSKGSPLIDILTLFIKLLLQIACLDFEGHTVYFNFSPGVAGEFKFKFLTLIQLSFQH